MMPESTALNYSALIIGLGGGLALFLYGMRKMTESLKTIAGGGMKRLLARLTANRFTGALAGIIITAVIQSSSVTTVLVVGFISAGLLNLSQSIAVILGANVGTTITAQIIAFKITKYALGLIAVGFMTELTAKTERVKHLGIALMGLGLIFYGMELMSQATSPLRSYRPFIELMQNMKNPILGILAGSLFTALIQSSSATTGVVIVLAGEGFISLDAGIALILGSNIGTCVTAMLAAYGSPREAAKAAVVHLIFNVVGALIWLPFIPQFADLVTALSPASPELAGSARLAAETPRQIANAHTIFNLTNMVIFIWFTGTLARLANRLIPDQAQPLPTPIKSLYLDDYYLETPPLALDRVALELQRLGDLILDMCQRIYATIISGSREEIAALHAMDEEVDLLHGEIIIYLGKLSLKDLIEPQPQRLYEYIAAANYMENIGDVVESNVVADGLLRWTNGLDINADARELLKPLHAKTYSALELAIKALITSDRELAEAVENSKPEFNQLADHARNQLVKHLAAPDPERLTTFRFLTNTIENYKRIHTLSRRIAKAITIINAPPGEKS